MLVIYVNSRLNRRSGGEDRELTANLCLEVVPCPSLRSCGLAESSLMLRGKIVIPNKIDCENT
jgi:hypothetical protein